MKALQGLDVVVDTGSDDGEEEPGHDGERQVIDWPLLAFAAR